MNEKSINLIHGNRAEAQDEYVIPHEAGCSHEFSVGCLLVDETGDK